MLSAAARDPLWAFVCLLTAPFRIWKPLLGVLFLLVMALFVVGFGGRFALQQVGFGVGSVPFLALDLVTLLVLVWIVFRVITNPLIIHFGGRTRAVQNPALRSNGAGTARRAHLE
jgi:type IV secretion system protein VirD4